MWHATQGPFEVVYTPVAYVLAERIMNGVDAVGLRVGFLPRIQSDRAGIMFLTSGFHDQVASRASFMKNLFPDAASGALAAVDGGMGAKTQGNQASGADVDVPTGQAPKGDEEEAPVGQAAKGVAREAAMVTGQGAEAADAEGAEEEEQTGQAS